MLRNLYELANSSRENYHNTFVNEDFKLSRDFKERLSQVLEARNTTIQFFDYSAEITTSANKKIYCPNQWFYIATFVVEFASELIKYKQVLEEIAESDLHEMTKKQFMDKVKNAKDQDINDFAPELKEAIYDHYDEAPSSADYLCKFINDYTWWYGSKTIDRHDYFVSPTLHLLGLVNVSQSYVSDIVYFLASDRTLMEFALHLQEQEFRETPIMPGQNLIVYGAPGTGKSRYLEDNFTNLTRVVFHSESTYFEFVGNYKPTPLYKNTENQIQRLNGEIFNVGEPIIDYQFVPGPFINVLISALRNPETLQTLLIEEINRANAPSVFGDIFQLLDRKIDGSSQYKIFPNEDLRNYLMSLEDVRHYFSDGLFIPHNMNIVATMNSADQGVFVLDSAFKRRWRFKYMPIKEKGFTHENVLVNYAGDTIEWRFILNSINNKLKNLGINEDRLIGPYFISPDEINDNNSLSSKLLIYLWDDVLRYKRQEFFINDIRTYSELVNSFNLGIDVMDIKNDITDLLEYEQSLEEDEDLIEDDENQG